MYRADPPVDFVRFLISQNEQRRATFISTVINTYSKVILDKCQSLSSPLVSGVTNRITVSCTSARHRTQSDRPQASRSRPRNPFEPTYQFAFFHTYPLPVHLILRCKVTPTAHEVRNSSLCNFLPLLSAKTFFPTPCFQIPSI
jgi:hypothetical protein